MIGIVLYVGSRLFCGEEEKALAETFGGRREECRERVKIPWL